MHERSFHFLEPLSKYFASQQDIRLAILFGSLAEGRATGGSDADIAVLGDRELGGERRIELIEALARLTQRPVDLVDLSVAGVVVARSVLRQGKVLYARDDTVYPDQITRLLIDSADFLPLCEYILRERRHAWMQWSSMKN